jgi:hypothetical protein
MERRAMLKLGAAIPAVGLLASRGGKGLLTGRGGEQSTGNELRTAGDWGLGSNPLATPPQLRWEALARQIVATPTVQAAITEVLPVYLETGAGDPGHAQDGVQELAYATALTAAVSDPYRPGLVLVADPHRWFGTSVPGSRFGWVNPDNAYRWGLVDPASQYRIHGKRRYPGPKDVNISLLTDIYYSETVANLAYSDIEVAANGTFTITIDSSPANGRPNHLQLTAETTAIIVRNSMDDWATQNPDAIRIERVGGPSAPAPLTLDQLAKIAAASIAKAAPLYAHGFSTTTVPLNDFNKPPAAGATPYALATQRSAQGRFDLADSQALVIQVTMGGAGYFTLPVTDPFGVSIHPGPLQSSLNNFQADANADGSYTLVMSAHDPGVHNWLATDGVQIGTLDARWQLLPPAIPASGDLSISAKLVNFQDLASVLPAELRRVSPAQRARELELRNAAFLRRFQVPYPSQSVR